MRIITKNIKINKRKKVDINIMKQFRVMKKKKENLNFLEIK